MFTKAATLLMAAALSGGMTLRTPIPSVPVPTSAWQNTGWREISPGLYAQFERKGALRSVHYHATNPEAFARMVSLVRKTNPRGANSLLRVSSVPHLSRVGSGGSCTGSGSANVGTNTAHGYLTVSCTTSAHIEGEIDLAPVGAADDYKGYTAITNMNASLLYDFGADGSCNEDPCTVNPESWTAYEDWSADTGDSDYYCQQGADNGPC